MLDRRQGTPFFAPVLSDAQIGAAPPVPSFAPVEITPSPDSAPIVAGLEHQSGGSARGFRPAGTRDWLCVATLGGRGFVRTATEVQVLQRGDLLLFAPDTPQDYGYFDDDSAWFNIWAHFHPRPHWIPWLVWPPKTKGVMVLSTGDAFALVEPELRRMVDVSTQPTRLRHDTALNALERVLIACDDLNPLNRTAHIDPRIRKSLEIVGEKIAEPLSIDGLSRAVGLSRSRFCVLFTEQTNLSPQAYIEFVRLNRAAQLLLMTFWPVTHIAEAVGFSNPYYFSTRFRARYGVPPTVFRTRREARPTGKPAV